jgi:hypothetical protein
VSDNTLPSFLSSKKPADPSTKELLAQNRDKGHETRRQDNANLTAGRPSGSPRKRRAAQAVAEAAKAREQQLTNVFIEATDEGQPMRIRLEGAKEWLRIEREEDKLQLAEDAYADATREDLAQMLIDKLSDGPLAEVLRNALGVEAPSIEGTATEIEDV